MLMKTIEYQKTGVNFIVGGTREVKHDITISTTQSEVDKLVKSSLPEKLPPPFIKHNMDGNKPVTIGPKFN